MNSKANKQRVATRVQRGFTRRPGTAGVHFQSVRVGFEIRPRADSTTVRADSTLFTVDR